VSSLKTNIIETNLLKKGFIKKDKDHSYYYYHTIDGKKTAIFTKISHGEKEINDYLISCMSKQLKVKKDFFIEFVSCTKNQIDYNTHLQKNNHI